MATLDLLCNLLIRAFLVMILCRLPQSCREHLICNTVVEKWASWQPRYRILTALTLGSFNAALGTN